MKKYTVRVKQIYTYEDVPANSKSEAIEKVRNLEWNGHNEQDQPLEFTALDMRSEDEPDNTVKQK